LRRPSVMLQPRRCGTLTRVCGQRQFALRKG
jgi:hypothetical protein